MDGRGIVSRYLDLSPAPWCWCWAQAGWRLQKLKGLPEGVAQVRVVAPKAHAEVLAWLKKHPKAEYLARAFEPGDLRGCRLLFCCTPDAELNAFAARQAKALGAWVCQAAEPDQGDLRVPAVISAAGLQMTLSTGGASPALAKALRAHFEKSLKASDLGFVLAGMKKLRPALKKDPAAKAALIKQIASCMAAGLGADAGPAPQGRTAMPQLQKLLKASNDERHRFRPPLFLALPSRLRPAGPGRGALPGLCLGATPRIQPFGDRPPELGCAALPGPLSSGLSACPKAACRWPPASARWPSGPSC